MGRGALAAATGAFWPRGPPPAPFAACAGPGASGFFRLLPGPGGSFEPRRAQVQSPAPHRGGNKKKKISTQTGEAGGDG